MRLITNTLPSKWGGIKTVWTQSKVKYLYSNKYVLAEYQRLLRFHAWGAWNYHSSNVCTANDYFIGTSSECRECERVQGKNEYIWDLSAENLSYERKRMRKFVQVRTVCFSFFYSFLFLWKFCSFLFSSQWIMQAEVRFLVFKIT